MDSLFYALVILGIIVLLIALYGFIQGGTSGMLEKEMNHNTIDADLRIETTRYIDFFKQVKRVDSIYVHQATKTFQIKKNNRLSKAFNYEDITQIKIEFNDEIIGHTMKLPFFDTKSFIFPDEMDAGDWSLSITTAEQEFFILFESFMMMRSVMDQLKAAERAFDVKLKS